jgi:hypothetical protein
MGHSLTITKKQRVKVITICKDCFIWALVSAVWTHADAYARLAVKERGILPMRFSLHGWVISIRIWVVTTPELPRREIGGFLKRLVVIVGRTPA